MKLIEQLNFDKESFLEMTLLATEAETSIQRFEAIQLRISTKFNPILIDYLKGLQLDVELGKLTTEEEILEYQTPYITPDFKRQLATELDEIEGLDSVQRFFMFETLLTAYLESASNYLQPVFHTRLKELSQAKFNQKRKLILP